MIRNKPIVPIIITVIAVCLITLIITITQMFYLPILIITQNQASDADLTIISSINYQIGNSQFSITHSNYLPLLSRQEVDNWTKQKQQIKGTAPRWIFPITYTQNLLDGFILIMNQSLEKQLGLGRRLDINQIGVGEIVIKKQTADILNKDIGDTIQFNFSINDIVNAQNYLPKFVDFTSSQDPNHQSFPQLNSSILAQQIYLKIQSLQSNQFQKQLINRLFQALNIDNTQEGIQSKLKQILNTPLSYIFTIGQIVDSAKGKWPSSLRNSILVDINQLFPMVSQAFQKLFLQGENFNQDQKAIYKKISQNLQRYYLTNYAPIYAASFNSRGQFYKPRNNLQQALMPVLIDLPANMQVLGMLPLYINFSYTLLFFHSILQIYLFLVIIIISKLLWSTVWTYYSKQAYLLKIYRMIGYGGVTQIKVNVFKKIKNMVTFIKNKFRNQEYVQYQQSTKLKQLQKPLISKPQSTFLTIKIPFQIINWQIWSLIVILLFILSMILKKFIIIIFCKIYMVEIISQNLTQLCILIVGVILNIVYSIYEGLRNIWGGVPKYQMFGAAKVQVIEKNKYSFQSVYLILGALLIYYGISAYYIIPQAAIKNKMQREIFFLNTIFILLFLGILIILSLFQSKVEWIIYFILCRIKSIYKIGSILFTDLKNKEYKYKHTSVVFSLICAFLIFLNTGISIQIQLIQSLIAKNAGADLTFYDFLPNGLNKTQFSIYLQKYKEQGIISDYTFQSKQSNSYNFMGKLYIHSPTGTKSNQVYTVSPNYLQSTYYKYYKPQYYYNQYTYPTLPNGIQNGLQSIYNLINGTSKQHYIQSQTQLLYDQDHILSPINYMHLEKNQQVINLIVSSTFLKLINAKVGDMFHGSFRYGSFRFRIVHSVQSFPGALVQIRYLLASVQQFQYMYTTCRQKYYHQRHILADKQIKYSKVFIQLQQDKVQQIIQNLIKISHPHIYITNMYQVKKSISQGVIALKIILIISTILNLGFLFALIIHSLQRSLLNSQPFYLMRTIGLSSKQLQIIFFIQQYVEIFVSSFFGVGVGLIVSYVWGTMVSNVMQVGLQWGGGLWAYGVVFIIIVLGVWVCVKIGVNKIIGQNLSKMIKTQ